MRVSSRIWKAIGLGATLGASPIVLSAVAPADMSEKGAITGAVHMEGSFGSLPSGLLAEPSIPTFSYARYKPAPEALRANGATGDEDWVLRRWSEDEGQRRHYRLKEYIGDLEVIGGDMIIHTDAAAKIIAVDVQLLSAKGLPQKPLINAAKAADVAKLQSKDARLTTEPNLKYLRTVPGQGYLVWVAQIGYPSGDGVELVDDVFIDAMNGTFVERRPLVLSVMSRSVYDANNATTPADLPGTLLITEGGSSTDTDAQKAYNYAGYTYSYYSTTHGRDSWNGSGANMRSSVHFGVNHNNAHWYGSLNQASFGDGDGTYSRSWSRGLDVVGHEFTHGVIRDEANLTYANESGAMNESIADIFGAMVEKSVSGLSADTWKCAEDVRLPVGTTAIRSMSNPTSIGSSKDWYPEALPASSDPSDSDDYGWVHYNSGISNLAFYLLSQGGSHPRGKTTFSVSGVGTSVAERVFYLALRDYMTSSDGFVRARATTALVARNEYGTASAKHIAVCRAWDAVGVPNDAAQCPTNGSSIGQPTALSFDGNCMSQNLVSVSAVSGATSYEFWKASGSADFSAATRVYSGIARSTTINIGSGTAWVKGKACNAVGCSIYTSQAVAVYNNSTCTW